MRGRTQLAIGAVVIGAVVAAVGWCLRSTDAVVVGLSIAAPGAGHLLMGGLRQP